MSHNIIEFSTWPPPELEQEEDIQTKQLSLKNRYCTVKKLLQCPHAVVLRTMAQFNALKCSKTLVTHVAVGMGAASFWRGAWYLLDDNLFPESPSRSAAASLALGSIGMVASQGLVERAERLAQKAEKAVNNGALSRLSSRPKPLLSSLAVTRFGALYAISLSCVLVWRGTWIGWDCLYEHFYPTAEPKSATDPGHATRSGLMSHCTAIFALLGTGLFASVLAPPAAASVIRDLAVRSGSSYSGPAQRIANRFLGAPITSTIKATAMSRSLSSSSQQLGINTIRK